MAKLISTLPVGAKIKDPASIYDGQPLVWRILEHSHTGDPAGTTALQTNICICQKAFDAKEPSNSDSNRKSYGNNRYKFSNLLQWLNSSGAANAWYSAQHAADHEPDATNVSENPYVAEKGFMAYLGDNFKNALVEASKTTVLSTTDGGGSETVSSKIWLLSTTEVGLANENSIAEGSKYAYFTEHSADADRIMKDKGGTARYWWLRTPNYSSSHYARDVSTSGTLGSYAAYNGSYAVAPACCVLSSLTVSSEPDADGCYLLNCPPEIAVNKTAFGDRNLGFDLIYKVTDEEGDSTNVTVALDGATVQEHTPIILGQSYTYAITDALMDSLAAGLHNIVITANDGISNVTTTCTFTKVVTLVEISGEDINLGNIWAEPTGIKYRVSDPGSPVTLTEYTDGVLTRTISPAIPKHDYTFDTSGYAALSDEQSHTFKVQATDGNGSDERTWTFTKLPEELILTTDTIGTDIAATSINVILRYTKTGNPTPKIEVSNDSGITWEDMTTDWANGTAHVFENRPALGYGVKVRITITKNPSTERVYLNAFGFSYT